MANIIQTWTDIEISKKLIDKEVNFDKVNSKFIKVGSFLPRWDLSHVSLWNSDMQNYLHDSLQQYSLDYQVNGNNLLEIISFP